MTFARRGREVDACDEEAGRPRDSVEPVYEFLRFHGGGSPRLTPRKIEQHPAAAWQASFPAAGSDTNVCRAIYERSESTM